MVIGQIAFHSFQGRVSHSPGWPRTFCVAKSGFELLILCLLNAEITGIDTTAPSFVGRTQGFIHVKQVLQGRSPACFYLFNRLKGYGAREKHDISSPSSCVPQDTHGIFCPLCLPGQHYRPLCRTSRETSPVLTQFHGRAGVDMFIGS